MIIQQCVCVECAMRIKDMEKQLAAQKEVIDRLRSSIERALSCNHSFYGKPECEDALTFAKEKLK